jgi:outer membrane protein assembly factor BamB
MHRACKYLALFVELHLCLGIKLPLHLHNAQSKASSYYWSSGRGSPGNYSASPYPAPFYIEQPTWTWHREQIPRNQTDLDWARAADKWSTVPVGTSIDDQKAIYLTCAEGIRKFSPDGALKWTWTRQGDETMTKAAALMDGVVFGITTKGRVFAVSMDTGSELWSTTVAEESDGNYGHVQADAGVVITAAEVSSKVNVNHKVVGLNGTNGHLLWSYEPAIPIWNFGSSFVGDGTFIFQDLEGRVHRNRVSDGSLIWKSGGIPESWTDGQANLGPNGVAYGVANYGTGPNGCLSAYRVSDGKMLWRQNVSTSPNSVPAIGRLLGQTGFSVVMPIGMNDMQGARIDVYAFNAETGAQQWYWKGYTQTVSMGLGDANPVAQYQRKIAHIQTMTLPNSWGIPAIDGQGTAYVGGITGHFVALRDSNGDGIVSGPDEESVLITDADWVGSSGPALAPGVLATANANSLFVWRS